MRSGLGNEARPQPSSWISTSDLISRLSNGYTRLCCERIGSFSVRVKYLQRFYNVHVLVPSGKVCFLRLITWKCFNHCMPWMQSKKEEHIEEFIVTDRTSNLTRCYSSFNGAFTIVSMSQLFLNSTMNRRDLKKAFLRAEAT